LVGTTIAAFFTAKGPVKDTLTTVSATTLFEVLLSVTAMIALTATALILFTRLRESTSSTDDLRAKAALFFERSFISAARRANSSVEAELGWPDLAFKEGGGRVAVEVKSNLNAMTIPRLRDFFADTDKRRDKGGYSCALIVSPRLLGSRARGVETDKVKVALPSEVLDRIRAAV
jgi:hypothetical protein